MSVFVVVCLVLSNFLQIPKNPTGENTIIILRYIELD